jgi:hypothetical protein
MSVSVFSQYDGLRYVRKVGCVLHMQMWLSSLVYDGPEEMLEKRREEKWEEAGETYQDSVIKSRILHGIRQIGHIKQS